MTSLTEGEMSMAEALATFDDPARECAKVVLPHVIPGISYLEDHPDKYDIDLIAFEQGGKKVGYVELESSRAWGKKLQFPRHWEGLSFLAERKKKYITDEKWQDVPMWFVMFNENQTAFAIVNREIIRKSPIVTRSRTWKPFEEFFMVPHGQFDQYVVKDLL